MDPLSALGIAAAVAQFLDAGIKIGKRLAEYNKASPHEVPRSLQSINTQLPLLLNALQRVKTDVEVDKFDLDTRCILKGVISGCIVLIEEVETILNKVAKTPGESLASKLRKTLASFKHDEKILAIDKNLQTYISVLILHHVIDSEEIPSGPPEEVDYYEVREKKVNPFYERAELVEQLDQLFYDVARSQVKEPSVVVMLGNRGVGKTQLALDYCKQSHGLGQFRTVFWLNAESPEALMLSLESAAAVVRRSTEGTRTEKLDAVNSFLSDRWHPWLLVLDAYDHKAFDRVGVLEHLPRSGYGAILITTSHRSAATLGNVLNVPKFLTKEERQSLTRQLMNAIGRSNLEQVRTCIESGASINELDINDWPHITRAAVHGDAAIFRLLLEYGADPDYRRGTKAHPLYWAANEGYTEIVRMCLDYEDRHDERQRLEDYDRAARESFENSHAEAAMMLVDRRGVNLHRNSHTGASFLRLAAKGGNEKLVRICLDHDAIPLDNAEKGEVLLSAASKFHVKIVKLLIDTGRFDANLRNERKECCLYYAIARVNRDSPPGDPEGVDFAEFLLKAGADPNAPNCADSFFGDGDTPVHSAASYGSPEKLQLLLKHGGNLAKQDKVGRNALVLFRGTDRSLMDPILLGTPMPDPEARKSYLNQGLEWSAHYNRRDLALAVLRAEGAVDINHVDSDGRTPLLIAIDGGHIEFVRMLIRYKPRQDIPDKKGRLPLLVAAEKGFDLTVRDLLKASKSPNQKNKNEETALHLAAQNGHEKVVKVLLDNGADPEEANKYGDIALDLAEEKKHEDVIKLLEEASLEKV